MSMPFEEFIIDDGRHPRLDGTRTRYAFPNGYGASVISGELYHCDTEHPYEIGLLKNGKLVYNLFGEGDDVLGFQTDADLMVVLAKVMELPKEQE
jgi:hypothetical protein